MIVEPSPSPSPRRAASGPGFGLAAWLSSAGAHATVLALLAAFVVPTAAPDSGAIAVDLVEAVDAAAPAADDPAAEEAPPVVADVAALPLPVEPAPPPVEPAPAPAELPEPVMSTPPIPPEVAEPTVALAFPVPPRKPGPPPETLQAAPPAPRNPPLATAGPNVAPIAAPAAPRATHDVGATALAGNPPPIYPDLARRRGLEGRVVLLVEITPEGRCGGARVVESSRHGVLDDAALDAVRRWRFQPARRDGVSIASSLRVPVAFRLTE